MYRLVVLLTMMIIAFASVSEANAKCRKAKVTACDIGPKANCSNVDLRGEELRGANLTGARITCANLEGANLESSNLSRANPVSYTHLTLPTKRIV